MRIVLDAAIILAVMVAVCGLTSIVAIWCIVNKNHKERRSKEQVWEGDHSKRALILFQPSLRHTVDVMALKAAEALQKQGYWVVANYPSKELNYDLKLFAVVVLGTAVYWGSGSEAALSYLQANPIHQKKVLLFSVGRALEEKGELDKMEELLGDGNFVCRTKVRRGQEEKIGELICRHFL